MLYSTESNTMLSNKSVISFEETKQLIHKVVALVKSSDFKPNTILALSTGGFPVAAAIAKQLGIGGRNVIGLPTYKDEAGDYHIDEEIVHLGDCTGRHILVIDEASKSGRLIKKAVDSVEEHGGTAKSCVLMAWSDGLQPDFVVTSCGEDVPDFYWEETD